MLFSFQVCAASWNVISPLCIRRGLGSDRRSRTVNFVSVVVNIVFGFVLVGGVYVCTVTCCIRVCVSVIKQLKLYSVFVSISDLIAVRVNLDLGNKNRKRNMWGLVQSKSPEFAFMAFISRIVTCIYP